VVAVSERAGREANSGDRGAPRRSRALVGVAPAAVLAAVLVVAAAVGAAGGGPTAGGPGPLPVAVTGTACSPEWALPPSGVVSFSVADDAEVAVDVELTNRADGAIVGALKVLGPGTSRPLEARLRAGTYRWLCIYDRNGSRWSAPRSVTTGVRAGTATPEAIPTTAAEMQGPLTGYEHYVAGQITVLGGEVDHLAADVTRGELTQARADWLSAELTFSGIGGTYSDIGPLENQINGLAAGHPGGVTTPTFVGLHHIEYLLWSGAPASAVEPFTDALVQSVEGLAVLWSEKPMTADVLSTRGHEILEDALRDTLSGDDDEGSGTELAQVSSDIAGDQVLLGYLRPLIEKRTPALMGRAEAQLHVLAQAVAATQVDGQWVPLSSLTTEQREVIDADTGQVLETLAPIPDLLEVQQFADNPGAT
jgi:high-affinity iron transporter